MNKHYPSQFLSSCLGGTAVSNTHTRQNARVRTHTRIHTRQPILPMADTDTAMQREGKGGSWRTSEQGEKSNKRRRAGDRSAMEKEGGRRNRGREDKRGGRGGRVRR